MSERICLLATAGPWHDHRYFYKHLPALAEEGFDVTYICRDPGKPVEAPCTFALLSPRAIRMARLTGGLSLLPRVLKLRPRAVHVTSLELLPLGIVLAVLFRKAVFYDCREDMPTAMLCHKTAIPRPLRRPAWLVTRILEYFSAKSFAGVIVSDPSIYQLQRAVPPERKLLFYNWPLLGKFPDAGPPLAERPFNLALVGSMTPRTGVISVVEAVAELNRRGRRVTLQMIGQPSADCTATIDRIVRDNNMAGEVVVTGRLEYDDVPDRIRQCQIGLVPLSDMLKFRHNIATKMFEYMACGMPVISSDLPPERPFIHHGVNGLLIEPGNITAWADAIADLLDHPDRAEAMGRDGRRRIEEQWNSEIQQKELRRFYRDRLDARRK
jgi:glycosyltransferase involved in cell wall biosynthesis